jgi:hypothetical protein
VIFFRRFRAPLDSTHWQPRAKRSPGALRACQASYLEIRSTFTTPLTTPHPALSPRTRGERVAEGRVRGALKYSSNLLSVYETCSLSTITGSTSLRSDDDAIRDILRRRRYLGREIHLITFWSRHGAKAGMFLQFPRCISLELDGAD